MEQFVKRLYDRLEAKKDLQMQLFVIMQNAINEMHNNGIIAGLTGDLAAAVHDPDPQVRVTHKTALAKAVAKKLIPSTVPVPSPEGMSYMATLNYDRRFVNSITLCFQGGIEGLHMMLEANKSMRLNRYVIQVEAGNQDLTELKTNIELLDRMYDEMAVVLMHGENVVYSGQKAGSNPVVQNAPVSPQTPAPQAAAPKAPAPQAPQAAAKADAKVGFWGRLFGKKG